MTASIDPRQLRPSRGWYALAFLLPVLGVIAGAVAFTGSFSSATKTVPKLILRSDSGASSSVQLRAGRSYQIYVPQDAVTKTSCALDDTTTATITPSLDDAAAQDLGSFTSGGVAWQVHDVVDVTRTGAYTISCGGTKFAIDDEDETDTARAKTFFRGAGVFAGLPCVGITLGILIGIVVAVRRGRRRRQLQQAFLQPAYQYPRPY